MGRVNDNGLATTIFDAINMVIIPQDHTRANGPAVVHARRGHTDRLVWRSPGRAPPNKPITGFNGPERTLEHRARADRLHPLQLSIGGRRFAYAVPAGVEPFGQGVVTTSLWPKSFVIYRCAAQRSPIPHRLGHHGPGSGCGAAALIPPAGSSGATAWSRPQCLPPAPVPGTSTTRGAKWRATVATPAFNAYGA